MVVTQIYSRIVKGSRIAFKFMCKFSVYNDFLFRVFYIGAIRKALNFFGMLCGFFILVRIMPCLGDRKRNAPNGGE